MKYAVISLGGTQHQVTENQILTIDRLEQPEDKSITTDQVLLTVNDDTVKTGQPTVKNASVEYKIISHTSGKKLRIFKYKAKSRYRRTQGFRPLQSQIQITKINL